MQRMATLQAPAALASSDSIADEATEKKSGDEGEVKVKKQRLDEVRSLHVVVVEEEEEVVELEKPAPPPPRVEEMSTCFFCF